MKKSYIILTLISFAFIIGSKAQNSTTYFDEKLATQQSIDAGIKPSEVKGYVEFLKHDFSSKQALKVQAHKHTPYENNKVQETVIYLNPNKTASAGCVNMGFEQSNFSGWSGTTGTTSVGSSGTPLFNVTGSSIVNTAGNNVSLVNTSNYHTIMTSPAINANYPACVGYDSLACKAIGSNTISQIPVVSPYSQDPVSVRLNGAVANYRASRLKYITTTSSTNRQLSFSFALVLQSSGHLANEAPYFKVEIRNETTGLLLAGCTSFTLNPSSSLPSDSLLLSAIDSYNPISYRKWQQSFVDLSTLPLGTNVSVNFEVGGCSNGGHWGYAYVDAECSSNNLTTSNMCSGSSFATLVAPQGLLSYQWFDQTNTAIVGATNDTLIVTSPIIGNIYSVQLTAIGGCVTTQTVAINTSTITVNNIIASGSCANGNSGTATVYVNGSSGVYSYIWKSMSTGSVVSNAQTANNLAVGNYSVLVSSGMCGQTTATISVPIMPTQLTQQTQLFCGNKTFIVSASGTNHQWYNGSTLIPAPQGINDTLYINNPINGSQYTAVNINAGGCKDSTKYTLALISGGYSYVSNIQNVCIGNSNGAAIINLNASNAAPYSYNVIGTSGVITNTITSALTLSLSPLSVGIYTATVYEGLCIYTNTFAINTIQTNYTMTPSAFNTCNPNDTARINFSFANTVPFNCGLSTTGNCNTPNQVIVGTGTQINTISSYPAIYGNWYRNTRHQILYTAGELIANGLQAGKISSIAFNINTVSGTTTYPDFTIKLKCTSVSDLSNLAFDQAGLTQVYYVPTTTITAGWNTYQFPTAYEWDGVSNLLVDVCNSQTMPTYSQNSQSPYTVTPFVSVRWFNSDGTVACPATTAYSSSSNRPNIKFENCGSNASTGYTISVSSNGTLVQNYNNDSIKIVPTVMATAGIIYTISITNAQGGCVSAMPYSVYPAPTLTVAGTNSICVGSSAVLTASGANTYTWNTGAATASVNVTPTVNTTYTVIGESSNNCSSTMTTNIIVDNTCQDVWPGDANSDGIADNLDVLELGLHYTQTGTARATMSNNWQSYHATNWTGIITNGENVNHSDCNGDGTINDNDTLAIFNNYNLTHAFKPTAITTSSAQISMTPDQAFVAKGTWGSSSIYLGDASTAINIINGVAFTVNYDNSLLETDSVWIEYLTSFINVSNQNLKFRKRDFGNGKLYTATTHTINGNVSGYGKIAILHYKIKSSLTTDNVLNLVISQANQSNASGTITPLTSGSATLMALGTSTTTKLNELTNGDYISLHPNPTNGVLIINSTAELQKVEVMAITGQLLMSEEPSSTNHVLHLDHLANGVYFVNLYQNNRIVKREKIILNK